MSAAAHNTAVVPSPEPSERDVDTVPTSRYVLRTPFVERGPDDHA